MAVLVGVLLGPEPPGRRQRNHRHARLRPGHRLLRARRFDRGRRRHAAGAGQLALSLRRAPTRPSSRWSSRWQTSQASYEIQPRVFYEDFHNFVLYVQDVRAGAGAANWRQVFMADVTDPANADDHHRRLGHRGQRFNRRNC